MSGIAQDCHATTKNTPGRGPRGAVQHGAAGCGSLALAGLHAGVLLVDHIDPAMAAHDTAVLVARLGRLQAVADLHGMTFGGAWPVVGWSVLVWLARVGAGVKMRDVTVGIKTDSNALHGAKYNASASVSVPQPIRTTDGIGRLIPMIGRPI